MRFTPYCDSDPTYLFIARRQQAAIDDQLLQERRRLHREEKDRVRLKIAAMEEHKLAEEARR